MEQGNLGDGVTFGAEWGEQLIFTVCLLCARHSVNGHLRRLNEITSKQPFEGGDGTLIFIGEEAEIQRAALICLR